MKNLETKTVSFKEANGEATFDLNLQAAVQAASVLRAVNHPLRQRILGLIDSKKGITVTEIYCALKVEQSVASMHLSILRDSEIVSTEREGKLIHYHLNEQKIKEVDRYSSLLAFKQTK